MMESADVCVILPFADHEHLVGKASRRIAEHFRASGLRLEIMAVNRGSQDNSQPVLHLLRSEIPELRVLIGRGYEAGVRAAKAPVLILMTPETAAAGLSESLTRAVREVAGGELDMKLVDENLLVCASSRCERLIIRAPFARHHAARKLLQRGRARGLSVRSYSPDEPASHRARISQVLAAVVPRSTGLYRAW